jgi:glycosyltransferase involved in cell wall biosynthesis
LSAAAAGTTDPPGRLIVDASTLIRWTGQPVGIVRVEAELVRHALERDAVVCVYDSRNGLFRPLDRSVARELLAGRAVVETSLLPDPRPIPRTPIQAAGRGLARRLQPVLKLRRTMAAAADERRRAAGEGAAGRAWTRAADRLLDRRLRSRTFAADGTRRALHRLDSVLGPPLRLTAADTVLSAGLDWNTRDAAALSALRARDGFRLVSMLYDLIPAVHPRFYAPRDVEVFTRYFAEALRHTDRFISISRRTSEDLAEFARARNLAVPDIRIEKLGADAARRGGTTLPAGLENGRYVLFVSTIEPRKNHALLLRVWKRLAARPQGVNGAKLVFAGRQGWMTGDVMAALQDDPVFRRDVVHVAGASDDELAALYAGAAFCVYPSLYEGFGLPVIEAFSHGKPVIASTGGALPEAAGNLAPCIDPGDDEAWTAAMARWLDAPAELVAQARRIRAEFSWPGWPEAASQIVSVALER